MVLFSLSKLCINKWPSGLVPSECLLRLTVVFHQDEPSPVPYAPANILIQFKGHVLFKLTEPSKVLTRAPLSLTPYRRKGIKKTITLRKLDHVNWLERKKNASVERGHVWAGERITPKGDVTQSLREPPPWRVGGPCKSQWRYNYLPRDASSPSSPMCAT